MAYPTNLDNLQTGIPSDAIAPTTPTGSATYPHDDHHRAVATAVEALQTTVGVTGAFNFADSATSTPLPVAADKHQFVSKGSLANDANDGLSAGSPKATVAAALAAIGTNPGTIELGYGAHTSSTLTLVAGNSGIVIRSVSEYTTLSNSAGHLFTVDTSAGVVYRVTFEDIDLRATGGHIFNVTGAFGVAYWVMDRIQFTQNSAGFRVWNQTAVSGNHIGMSVSHFQMNAATNSGGAWQVIDTNGSCNANSFTEGVVNVVATYAFWLECQTLETYCYDNKFANIVFEIPTAGAIKVRSSVGTVVDTCAVWDLSGATTADVLSFDTATGGSFSQTVTVRNFSRRGGTLGGGFADIRVLAGTVLIESSDKPGGTPTFTVNATGSNGVTSINTAVASSGIIWIGKPADTIEIGGGIVAVATAWVPATLAGTWANVTGETQLAYRKTLDGKHVEIDGRVGSGTIGSNIFTLPAAFRPVARHYVAGAVDLGGTALPGTLLVTAAGAVSVLAGNALYIHAVIPLDAPAAA